MDQYVPLLTSFNVGAPIIDFDNNIIIGGNKATLVTVDWIHTKLDGDCGSSFP